MIFQKRIALILVLIVFCAAPLIAQPVKYELKKVEFKGNSFLTSLELSKICYYSKESPGWFSKFLKSFTPFGSTAVYFDSLNVPFDVNLITDVYRSKGYFKVKVTPVFKLNAKEGTAEIVFNIRENSPSFFRSFEVTGLERLPADLQTYWQKEIIVDTSEVFSYQAINDKKEFIRSHLSNNGYMDVSDPQPVAMIDTVRNKVDVKMNFATGNRFKISEIKVTKIGSSKDLIDDGLIKDIFGIKPDTYFNQYENSKAQLRLSRTSLFDSLVLNRGYEDNINNTVPLEIIGKVSPLHELSPEVIANNEEDEFNLGLALSFIRKNFLGDARKMTITGTAATKNFTQVAYTDLRAAFDQPYLFGSLIRPRFDAYFTNQLWKDNYDAIFYGGKINLDFESELTNYTFLNSFSAYINWEYSRYDMKKKYLEDRLSSLDPAVIQKLNIGDQTIFSGDNAIIGLAFGHNKTNRISFPSRGVSASFLLEDGNSLLFLLNKLFNKQFNRPLYLKSILNISSFYPLWDPEMTTFGVKLKTGSILTYRGDKVNIPINQRFYGGGSNSVRGWKSRDLVPAAQSIVIDENTSNEDLESLIRQASPGGFLMFEGSFELRTKLNDFFATAAFIDYGNTWNTMKDVSLKSIAISTGLGFRLYIGVIPAIRFDLGFKLYDPYKHKLDLNKSIGNLFSENFEIQFGIGEAF